MGTLHLPAYCSSLASPKVKAAMLEKRLKEEKLSCRPSVLVCVLVVVPTYIYRYRCTCADFAFPPRETSFVPSHYISEINSS